MGNEFEKRLISQTPLGRFGRPEDIAPVAVFLWSGASCWITGEIILASGGMR
jgi:3-oxoacyl-[acyl-carrier protein] reductase